MTAMLPQAKLISLELHTDIWLWVHPEDFWEEKGSFLTVRYFRHLKVSQGSIHLSENTTEHSSCCALFVTAVLAALMGRFSKQSKGSPWWCAVMEPFPSCAFLKQLVLSVSEFLPGC